MDEPLFDPNESKESKCRNRFRINWDRYTFYQKYPAEYSKMVEDFCAKAQEEYPSLAEKKADMIKRYKAIVKLQRDEELLTFKRQNQKEEDFIKLHKTIK